MPLITLQNINKTFSPDLPNPVTALKGVHFTIERGEFISIMGPSGSGKSTLLNVLGLLDVPDSGGYILNNIEISKVPKKQLPFLRRKEIGFIFQTFNLLARLTVAQNIQLPLIYSRYPRKKQVDRINEMLRTVKLENRRNYKPALLSGGEKQRVAIARALVNDPSIILADEPTGNLDSKSGKDIMAALQWLNQQGRTIIVVTHDATIDAYAQRHFRMSDGELTEITITK
ncbi:MAG: ABC transporter ATP-binding protein [Patescibacteria group bacterium]